MSTTVIFKFLLMLGLALSLTTVSCSKNGTTPAEQGTDAGNTSSNNSQDANASQPFVAPENRVLELTETVGSVNLKAKLEGGAEQEASKISARVEIIKDGAVDQQAQGEVVFRLAGVESIDEEELAFIDLEVVPTDCEETGGDDEDFTGDVDECDDGITCIDEDNCPVTESLVKGEAVLFSDTDAYDITAYVAEYDAIEVRATYENPPAAPETVKKRFELAE